MNLRDGKQLGDRAKELLRAIALLSEPFTTRQIVSVARVRSSVNHFLIQFTEVGYLRVESKGKHNQPYSYVRGDKFPDASEITDKQKAAKAPEPEPKRTALEIAYWEMRNSFKIETKNDDELYQ